MSTSPDDRLGELSPPERDFALRRMPVESFRDAGRDAFGMPVKTLAEAYAEANVVPAADPPLNLSRFQRHEIDARISDARLLSRDLRQAGLDGHADRLLQVIESIREALK